MTKETQEKRKHFFDGIPAIKRYGTNNISFCLAVSNLCILVIFPIDLWSTTESRADVLDFFHQNIIAHTAVLIAVSALAAALLLTAIFLLTFVLKLLKYSRALIQEGLRALTFQDVFLMALLLSFRLLLYSHMRLMYLIFVREVKYDQSVNVFETILMRVLLLVEAAALLWTQLLFDMIFALYHATLNQMRELGADSKVSQWKVALFSFVTIIRFHMGTAALGAYMLVPAFLLNLLKIAFCIQRLPYFTPNLFVVCAIKGTDYMKSARMSSSLMSSEISRSVIKTRIVLALIGAPVVVATALLCAEFLPNQGLNGLYIPLDAFVQVMGWTVVVFSTKLVVALDEIGERGLDEQRRYFETESLNDLIRTGSRPESCPKETTTA